MPRIRQKIDDEVWIVIPVDGTGILDDRHAKAILTNGVYREILEKTDNFVEFRVGEKVTATSPEFWQTLLNSTLHKFMKEVEENPAKLHSDIPPDEHYRITFDGEESDNNDTRLMDCNKMAHRFVGTTTSFGQWFIHSRLAADFEKIGKTDMAERMSRRARTFKAGALATMGLV